MGHSCETLLWDTLVGHLQDTLVGHSCTELLWDTLWDTLVGHSCRTLLRDSPVGHCISLARRARSPQRVARAPDKAHSRLHFAHSTRAISAEGCASSLQNERFVRDFLKNSHVKVCKTSVSYETSSKSQAETPIGAHTSRSPAKQFRDSSPSKQHPCHTPIPM